VLRRQVLADNQQYAIQTSEFIKSAGISDLSSAGQDWTRLQELAERAHLPNDGFMSIIGSDTGRLICHPHIRQHPVLLEKMPGLATLYDEQARTRIIDVSSPDDDGNVASARGWATMPDGVHLIAVRDLPELGMKVLIHQREKGIRESVNRIIGAIHTTALTVIVVIVLLTSLTAIAITRQYENRHARLNANLVVARTRSLIKTRDATIFGLAKLAETRDDDTGEHLDRIREYVAIVASAMAERGHPFDDEYIRMLGLASSLHDVGKVGIPDYVLLKPGKRHRR